MRCVMIINVTSEIDRLAIDPDHFSELLIRNGSMRYNLTWNFGGAGEATDLNFHLLQNVGKLKNIVTFILQY